MTNKEKVNAIMLKHKVSRTFANNMVKNNVLTPTAYRKLRLLKRKGMTIPEKAYFGNKKRK